MVGKVFEVTEIDEYGSACVEKWWHHAGGGSHSLALASDEMEIVEGSGKARGSAAKRKPERKDHMTKAPTEFLNIDIDLRSVTDPTPFIDALGKKVLSQRIGKDGRAHWVRLILAGQPAGPGDAILQFAKFVAELPPKIRAIWQNAVSKEFEWEFKLDLNRAARNGFLTGKSWKRQLGSVSAAYNRVLGQFQFKKFSGPLEGKADQQVPKAKDGE
jgi:hypothetical protein